MNAEPKLPPTGEETRESGAQSPDDADKAGGRRNAASAADRLLPPFFPDIWEPDAYDECVLEWWEEAYLLECGSLHYWDDGGHHEHGEVLALVVVCDLEEPEREGDWVGECIALAGV